MASISNLGYLVLGVKDLEAWKQFAVDTIGLQPGRSEPGTPPAPRIHGYLAGVGGVNVAPAFVATVPFVALTAAILVAALASVPRAIHQRGEPPVPTP